MSPEFPNLGLYDPGFGAGRVKMIDIATDSLISFFNGVLISDYSEDGSTQQ